MRSIVLPLLIALAQLCLCLPQAQANEAITQYEFTWLLWEAERTDTSSNSIPTNNQWAPVRMPDSWTISKHPTPENMVVWYRFKIPDNLPQPFRGAILLDRILNNAEVYLNEDYLGNGGRIVAPIARNWNTPNLFRIASSSWKDSDNMLYIRLIGDGGYGLITPPSFGHYSTLKNTWYTPRKFIRIDLARTSFVLVAILSLFSLLMWQQTRHKILLFIGLAGCFWLVPLAYGFGQNIPISHPVFLRITHWCFEACVLFILLFARVKYQLPYKKILYYGWAYLAILAITLSLTPDHTIVIVANSLHIVTQLIVLYLVLYTARAFWRTRSLSDFSFSLGLAVIFTFYVHDVSLSLSKDLDRWFHEVHIGHLSLPVMFILLCFSLSSMYKNYVRQAQALKESLEQRLRQEKQRLLDQVNKHQNLLEQQRLSQERELIYNDLHDDLGAKLLSLVYASPNGLLNDLARSALQDLRDVVGRITTDAVPLSALLADMFEEQQRRCEKMSIKARFDCNDFDENDSYTAHKALQFRRFTRELIGVYIHQLSSSNITVNVAIGFTGLEISATSTGSITDIEAQSLQSRATRLQASLQIKQLDDTVQIVCWIPHNEAGQD